ncbi:MAG: hypothetical protein ACF8R9_08080 [Phycisphaerales bacterium JB054]
MGTIFIGHGGCGSAAMILRLWESGHACHGRPDIAFLPSDTPELTKSAREGMQILSEHGLEDRPTPEAAALFAERADGYRLDTGVSIFDNMAAYLGHVTRHDAHTWLCRAPMFGLLERCPEHRAVCLLRHPLHQYLSFTQHYRHVDWTEPFGGRFSPDAVRYFARAWNAFTADCLNSDSTIIRYEFAQADAAGDAFLAWLFEPLLSTKRYDGLMPVEVERLLCELTEPVWRRMYRDWELTDASTVAPDI